MRLNLGCADILLPDFTNVDVGPPADTIADLSLPWPWADSTVNRVIAHDIIEHIADRTHFMNELWRVMGPGARVEIITPNATKGAGYWQDPTHKSGWCLNSFQYYQDQSFAVGRLSGLYGIKARFKIIEIGETMTGPDPFEEVWKIRVVLEAVKGV